MKRGGDNRKGRILYSSPTAEEALQETFHAQTAFRSQVRCNHWDWELFVPWGSEGTHEENDGTGSIIVLTGPESQDCHLIPSLGKVPEGILSITSNPVALIPFNDYQIKVGWEH